jgi:hypothetical protein
MRRAPRPRARLDATWRAAVQNQVATRYAKEKGRGGAGTNEAPTQDEVVFTDQDLNARIHHTHTFGQTISETESKQPPTASRGKETTDAWQEAVCANPPHRKRRAIHKRGLPLAKVEISAPHSAIFPPSCCPNLNPPNQPTNQTTNASSFHTCETTVFHSCSLGVLWTKK